VSEPIPHPIPVADARRIAEEAVRLAKVYGEKRGWKAHRRLRPLWAGGVVGIRDPLKFLVYQDRGTAPRLMWENNGKIIPIHDKTGVHFVLKKDVGKPGWGGPPGARVWKQQKWRHPGIKPTHFMSDALNQAIAKNTGVISEKAKRAVKPGDSPHDYFLPGGPPTTGTL
jgi:hypothetical protein